MDIQQTMMEVGRRAREASRAAARADTHQKNAALKAIAAAIRRDAAALLAANGRADALSAAEQAAAAEQGREQRRRFLEPGAGYQPGGARMFPDGN